MPGPSMLIEAAEAADVTGVGGDSYFRTLCWLFWGMESSVPPESDKSPASASEIVDAGDIILSSALLELDPERLLPATTAPPTLLE